MIGAEDAAPQRRAAQRVAWLIAGGFALAMTAALGRVAQLQVAPPEQIRTILALRERAVRETPPRADLLDRRGRPLAVSRPAWRVFVDPAQLPGSDAALDALTAVLADAIDSDPEALLATLRDALARSSTRTAQGRSPLRYARLTGPIDDSHVDAVRALARLAVHLERVEVRQATPGLNLGPIVGKVGFEGNGLVGVERAEDKRMRSAAGSLRVARNARGAPLWLEQDHYTPPAPGSPTRLTIDALAQRIAVEELWRGVAECDAAGGRIVAIDPRTGEILALADVVRNLPDAIPAPISTPQHSTEQRTAGEELAQPRYRVLDYAQPADPALARLRSVEDIFEPGSTFKPFIWSVITERGLLAPTDIIDTEQGIHRTPYGRVIRDVVTRSEQSWEDVLVNSSNIGMVKAATRLSPSQLHDAMLAFGFGAPTGVELPSEAQGIVTPLARWNQYTHTSVAFGQEVGVTALQMVRAFSVFARSAELAGTMPQLKLIASPHAASDQLLVRVLSPATVKLVRAALGRIVERARERLLQEGVISAAPKYSMFGKSGTADMPHPQGVGYLKGQYVSSFIAAAPADEPAIVVLVVIDDPGPATIAKRRHYGSWTAGPVVHRFVERVLPYLGAPADMPKHAALAETPPQPQTE